MAKKAPPKSGSGGSFLVACILIYCLVHFHILSGLTGFGGGGVYVSGTGEHAWDRALLHTIGAPANRANIDSLVAWRTHESPWDSNPPDGALYTNNPLNTGESGYGGSLMPNGQTMMYPSEGQGIAATAATLENGWYNDLLTALRNGWGICGYHGSLGKWSFDAYTDVC